MENMKYFEVKDKHYLKLLDAGKAIYTEIYSLKCI